MPKKPDPILRCRMFSPVNGERDELPKGLKKATRNASVPPSLRKLARMVAGMPLTALEAEVVQAAPRPPGAYEVTPGALETVLPLRHEEAGAFVLLEPIAKITCDHGDGPGPCVQYRIAVFDAPRVEEAPPIRGTKG